MDNENAFPFDSADAGIDMIDKVSTPSGNGASAAHVTSGDPVEMARELASSIERMMVETQDLRAWKQGAEAKLREYADLARSQETLTKALAELGTASLSAEELISLEHVLQALAQDPNHIMVLASVAQQAGHLQDAVGAFSRMQAILRQTSSNT